jgi:hypothetical protein
MTAQKTKSWLEPGIYRGLADDHYFADRAVSNSDIKLMLGDGFGEYWRQSWMNPERKERKADTDAMRLGKAFHFMLLEPESFHDHYFIMPGGVWDKTGKRQMISLLDYKAMREAGEVVRRLGKDYLFNPAYGYPEITVVWRDPVTGVMCRAKHDFFCWGWTVDYKTVDSITHDNIHRTIRRYKYNLQHHHYLNGRRAVRNMLRTGKAHWYGEFSDQFVNEFMKEEQDEFTFVFMKKQAPYTARACILSDDSADQTQHEIQRVLMEYKRHLEQYREALPWPDVPSEIEEVSLFYGFQGN